MRLFSRVDQWIKEIDGILRAVTPPHNRVSKRPCPGQTFPEPELTPTQKKHIAGLMRVNHSGEVCAQALYQGQALGARSTEVQRQMKQAAEEEIDHLAWCEQRLQELNSRPSILNPGWYFGALTLGAIAGLLGDKISLGFLAETERQVGRHLQHHLSILPRSDVRTKTILEHMVIDEAQHAETASLAGGVELPFVIKKLMALSSQCMTKTSYWV